MSLPNLSKYWRIVAYEHALVTHAYNPITAQEESELLEMLDALKIPWVGFNREDYMNWLIDDTQESISETRARLADS